MYIQIINSMKRVGMQRSGLRNLNLFGGSEDIRDTKQESKFIGDAGEKVWDQMFLPEILNRIFDWSDKSPYQRKSNESSSDYDNRVMMMMGITDESIASVSRDIEALIG